MSKFLSIYEKSLFTIVVIPDSQKYSEHEHMIKFFDMQIDWIIRNKKRLNIKFVTHVGDMVQNDTIEEEFIRAYKSISKLDGIVPYGISAGNHDMHIGGKATFFKKYYNIHKQKNLISCFNNSKNSAFTFSYYDDEYMIMHIEFAPTDEVLDWANDIIKNHPRHRVILTNHGFLTPEEDKGITTRYSRLSTCDNSLHFEGDNAGIDIYNKLILPYDNIFIVLSGHYYSQRTMKIIANRTIYAIQSDYNLEKPYGGNAWMRVMQFVKTDSTINIHTYSPFFDKFKEGDDSNFKLKYDFTTGDFYE